MRGAAALFGARRRVKAVLIVRGDTAAAVGSAPAFLGAAGRSGAVAPFRDAGEHVGVEDDVVNAFALRAERDMPSTREVV
jgi:hypothetical protein